MTQDRGSAVDRALAALSGGDADVRRAAAESLAALDVAGRTDALLAAFDAAADDDVVRFWIAVALARAGQDVAFEELFGGWRNAPDRAVLADAYPRQEQLAARLRSVLPLPAAGTPVLEHYAGALAGTWLGTLARMLLGREPEPEAVAPPPQKRRRRGPRARPGLGGGDVRVNVSGDVHGNVDGPGFGIGVGVDDFGFEGTGPRRNGGGFDLEAKVRMDEKSVLEEGGAEESSPPILPSPQPRRRPAAPAEPSGAGDDAGAGTESESVPEAAPAPEPVLLGGSAPRRAAPGDTVLVQLSAYIAAFEPMAREELQRSAEPDEIRLGQETDCRWAKGVRVSVRCRGTGLVIPEPVQQFVWDGECRTVQFDVEVPQDARPHKAVIVLEAFVHDREDAPDAVQVARLRLPLEIAAGAVATSEPVATVRATAAKTAFASYASQDRLDVLGRVSSIEVSAGIKVWMDVIDLRMGDRWNNKLDEHIRSSDRFLLFWSEHAADSEWVAWERKKAVELHGEEVLELHLLRFTPIEKVPEDLRKYHFNDVHLLAIDAQRYRDEQAAKSEAAARRGRRSRAAKPAAGPTPEAG